MASTSSTDLHVRLPDDTVLVMRRFDGPRGRCALVLPDFGHAIGEYDGLCGALSREMTVFLLELRGHGLSEGSWSHVKQRSDIDHILAILRERYSHVSVVAHGFSASIMLERESEHARPDSMVLIAPVFTATERFFRRHRRVHEHPGPFHLAPIRVKTPTVMLLPPHSDISALHHVAGACIRKCAEGLERTAAVRDALRIVEHDAPIRARRSSAPPGILR